MAAAKVFRAPNNKVVAHLDKNVVSKCNAVRDPIDGPYVRGGREKYARLSDCERIGVRDAAEIAAFEESLMHWLACCIARRQFTKPRDKPKHAYQDPEFKHRITGTGLFLDN